MTDSARVKDQNGYITIENNPITRVGVFPYLGRTISSECDPEKIYFVYRPAEELADPECQNSFKLLPFIDNHAMLGPSDAGYLPAEKKGVHGITGERVDFDGDVLYSDLKIFSETLAGLIQQGKKDVSLGYRCKYDYAPGTFAGQSYDFVQRSLRGNHIALVDQARCDVSVLDNQITMDRLDLNNTEKDEPKMTLDEALKALDDEKKKSAKLQAAMDEFEKEKDKDAKDDDDEEAKKKKEASDAEEAEKKEKEAKDAEEKKDDDKMKGMDAALTSVKSELEALKKGGMKQLMGEINARNKLAGQVEQHVGTFDHAEMTLDEVAAYGVDKLKIKCDKGQERSALDGFLQGRAAAPGAGNVHTVTFDSKEKSKGLDTYINKSA